MKEIKQQGGTGREQNEGEQLSSQLSNSGRGFCQMCEAGAVVEAGG